MKIGLIIGLFFTSLFSGCVEANKNKGLIKSKVPTEKTAPATFQKTKGLLVCRERKINYGYVKKGDTIIQEFKFYNKGTEMVKILGYDPSCNCTALEVSKIKIQPQDSTTIKMVVATGAKSPGKHLVTTTIKTSGQRTFYLLTTSFNLKANTDQEGK